MPYLCFCSIFRVSELSEQIQLMTNEKKDMEESLSYKDNEVEVCI